MGTTLRLLLSMLMAEVTLGSALLPQTANAITLYASTGGSGSGLYTIDTDTHAVTLLGNPGLNKVAGIDFDASGNLYATDGGSAGPSSLYILNSTNGSVISNQGSISADPFVQGIGSIAFDASGTLWASVYTGSANGGGLATINPGTGAVLTSVLNTGTGNALMLGLDFDVMGTLFGSRGNSFNHTEDLVTVNTTTGVETAIGTATNSIADIVFGSDGVLYGAEARNGDLFAINPTTGAKTFLFNTGLNLSGLTERTAAAIPEPSTIILLGLGLVGLGVAGRRKLVG